MSFSSSYDKVKRGPLKLKGNKSSHPYRVQPQNVDIGNASTARVVELSGRLVATGTNIQGLNTLFKEEAEIGDVLIIRNPQTHKVDRRIITEVASNRSLTISEKLSADFVSTVEASVQKDSEVLRSEILKARVKDDPGIKGELREGEEEGDLEAVLQKRVAERVAQQKTHVSYLERTAGYGYKTVVEEVDKDLTRGELLEFRAKKVHDKYC